MVQNRPGQKIKMTSIDELLCVPEVEGTEKKLSELPKGEQEILKLLCLRLAEAVSGPCRYSETVVEAECADYSFKARQIQKWLYEYIRENGVPKTVEISELKNGVDQGTLTQESMIEYVADCLKGNTSKVRNIKKYLLAALFNAPTTISGYYQAEVNHDMPQFARY